MSRKNSGATPIPKDHQKEMRLRLRMLRESRGIQKTEVTTISAGSLVKYEEHDLSSARIGDLYALAKEYGVEPQELMVYLFAEGDYDPDLTPTQRRVRRLEAYLSSLDELHQELAVDLVQRIVTHTVDQRTGKQVERISDKLGDRERDAKTIVRAALSEARQRER